MRSFHREAGYKSIPSAKALTSVVIEHHEKRVPQQNLWVKFGSGKLPTV